MKATDYAPSTPLESRPGGGFVPSAQRLEALRDALSGVELGAFDVRILTWLASWDDTTVRTVVSLLMRARAAGGAR